MSCAHKASLMKDLLKPCKKIYMKPFDESLANKFILERFRGTEMVRKLFHELLKQLATYQG